MRARVKKTGQLVDLSNRVWTTAAFEKLEPPRNTGYFWREVELVPDKWDDWRMPTMTRRLAEKFAEMIDDYLDKHREGGYRMWGSQSEHIADILEKGVFSYIEEFIDNVISKNTRYDESSIYQQLIMMYEKDAHPKRKEKTATPRIKGYLKRNPFGALFILNCNPKRGADEEYYKRHCIGILDSLLYPEITNKDKGVPVDLYVVRKDEESTIFESVNDEPSPFVELFGMKLKVVEDRGSDNCTACALKEICDNCIRDKFPCTREKGFAHFERINYKPEES